jgi:hypothetical protein
MKKIKGNTAIQAIIDKPRKITGIKPARRLLAHIIYEFQRGAVRSEDVKTLAYLLIKYGELYKLETLAEMDERIERLEKINAKF